MTFAGQELYPSLHDKTAALGFSLIQNHAFVDGNKRIGFYSMATFVEFNGATFVCTQEEAESVILEVAKGVMCREDFATWIATVVVEHNSVDGSGIG